VVAVTKAGGAISLLVGVVLLRLSLTGDYQRYVRVGMGPWLILAAVAVTALGLVTLVLALRRHPAVDAHDLAHGHDHGEATGVGWLLLAPIAALLLVAPPTLGSYGVDRAAHVDVRSGRAVFTPLARHAQPVPMGLLEFGQRAFEHGGASFNGAAVQLTGFVAGAESEGFRLARYQIACCAADATPVVVKVVGTEGDPPQRDQWVTVTGTFRPANGDLPELTATTINEIDAPEDPYE
jgi:uncharacterized repeat protein (TIGR03943 family)